MICFCILDLVVISILFLSQSVNSTRLYKCTDFEGGQRPSESFRGTTTGSHDLYESLIIPPHLMSHESETAFRLEVAHTLPCGMNYEIIRISLNASAGIRINNGSGEMPSALDYDREEEVSLNNSSLPAPYLTNSSSHDGFVYFVENVTKIAEERGSCDRKLSTQSIQFTPGGFLFYSEEYYRPNEYCIQEVNESDGWLSIRKCNADCNDQSTPCIRLCCHLHEYMDLNASCCQTTLGSEPMFQPVIYEDINRRLSLEEDIDSSSPKAGSGRGIRPHYMTFKFLDACPDGYSPSELFFNEHGESVLNTRIHVQNTGKLTYIGSDRKWHILENFCVAGIVNQEALQQHWEGIEKMTSVILYCLEDEVEADPTKLWYHYIYLGSYCFSSVFLFLTALVYVVLWDKQNIHGWTIISFVLSQFFLLIFLSVSTALSLFTYSDSTSKTIFCVGSAILAHFFFLSTFAWLTIINLDLWWTFKSLTPLSERSKGRKRFCLYMVFAWGIPTTTIVTGLTLQHIYKENSTGVIVPDYGDQQCVLASHAKGVYLYYILGVLLLINMILISLTFFTIYKFKKSTRMATSSSSKNKERSFKLFLKLIIIMGVTWGLEFIMWLENGGETFSWHILAIDVFNVLQAVAIFIIFVCKRKILNQIEQKYPSLRVLTKPILKLLANRSVALSASTDSKPTRSTTVSSSVKQGSRRKSLKASVRDSRM